jgi:hypothetical protein
MRKLSNSKCLHLELTRENDHEPSARQLGHQSNAAIAMVLVHAVVDGKNGKAKAPSDDTPVEVNNLNITAHPSIFSHHLTGSTCGRTSAACRCDRATL